MSPERVRQVLFEWFSNKNAATIVFRETVDPINDSDDSYVVSYEAVFEPTTLDLARVELWVTDDGCVAIGFETRERIAARLGIKNRRGGFAAGHEPYPMTEQGLLAILDEIANGNISIFARNLLWIGLGAPKAVVLPKTLERLISKGGCTVAWLQTVKPMKFMESGRLLHYRAWNEMGVGNEK